MLHQPNRISTIHPIRLHSMVKPLSFKGDKKPKKRKRPINNEDNNDDDTNNNHKSLQTTTNSTTEADEDDTWVSADTALDITGPIVLVLSSTPPTALASDANGKIFASPLENILDGDPATAEPHDVRQVWVANRVAGSEKLSFKGHHGRYLGADVAGVLSALREAVSVEEGVVLVPVPEYPVGCFGVQTARERFVSVEEKAGKGVVEVRADAEQLRLETTVRVRMQARFKPKLKRAKEEKALGRISRKELEEMAGRRLEEGEVKMLKKARREGGFHEAILDVKVKGKHDKFA